MIMNLNSQLPIGHHNFKSQRTLIEDREKIRISLIHLKSDTYNHSLISHTCII